MQESHFTDWHASTMSRSNSHIIRFVEFHGAILLLHSAYSNTWPQDKPNTGQLESWPGSWSQDSHY